MLPAVEMLNSGGSPVALHVHGETGVPPLSDICHGLIALPTVQI
jgi:hypothetical protein